MSRTKQKPKVRVRPKRKSLFAGTGGNTPKINWYEAETLYVTDASLPPVADVAAKYGVSTVTAYKWAHKKEWGRKRKEYWESVNKGMEDTLRQEQIVRYKKRIDNVSRLIDELLEDLHLKGHMDEMGTGDLLRLMAAEKEMLDGLPKPNDGREDDDAMREILNVQITRIRTLSGARGGNFNKVVNSGLRRLGLMEGEPVMVEAGDGDTEA